MKGMILSISNGQEGNTLAFRLREMLIYPHPLHSFIKANSFKRIYQVPLKTIRKTIGSLRMADFKISIKKSSLFKVFIIRMLIGNLLITTGGLNFLLLIN